MESDKMRDRDRLCMLRDEVDFWVSEIVMVKDIE